MDFEFARSQLIDVLLRPAEVARTTKIRKHIKNHWARDDPAFCIASIACIIGINAAYCVCFTTTNVLHIARVLFGCVLFEYLLVGVCVASAIRFYVNSRMRIQRMHTVEQSVEWMYAWDIHCNAVFAAIMLVACVLYCLIPCVIGAQQHTFIATAIGNTIWLAGAAYYAYITFIGYAGAYESRETSACA